MKHIYITVSQQPWCHHQVQVCQISIYAILIMALSSWKLILSTTGSTQRSSWRHLLWKQSFYAPWLSQANMLIQCVNMFNTVISLLYIGGKEVKSKSLTYRSFKTIYLFISRALTSKQNSDGCWSKLLKISISSSFFNFLTSL